MNNEETKMILNELSVMKTQMNEQFDRIDEQFETLNRSVTDIRLTLENETNRNIRFLAEGHMNLDRKLNDALKVESEKELLIIRVNALENEVRKLKERSEVSA